VSTPSFRTFATESQDKGDTIEDLKTWSNLNQEGMTQLRSGNPQELNNAERCFREASNLMAKYPMLPYRSLSLANLASCLVRKGRYNDAINMFRPLLLELPMFTQVSLAQIATVHMELATAYELIGDLSAASRELNIASSRFVAGASNYMKQIYAMNQPAESVATSATSQQRQLLTVNTINAWKSALGCRFSAAVLLHKQGEWEASEQNLQKLLIVYKYMLACVEVTRLNPNLSPTEVGALFPPTPTEALIVTSELVYLLPGLDQTYLDELFTEAVSDITNVQQSVAAVNMDLQNIEVSCAAYEDAVRLTLRGDQKNFMAVISDISKSLRLLYEKLQYEHATSEFDERGQRIKSSEDDFLADQDPRAVVFRHASRETLARAMKAIDRCRSHMRGIFQEYVKKLEEEMRNTKTTVDRSKLPPELLRFFEEAFPRVMAEVKADMEAGLIDPVTGEVTDAKRRQEIEEDARRFREKFAQDMAREAAEKEAKAKEVEAGKSQ